MERYRKKNRRQPWAVPLTSAQLLELLHKPDEGIGLSMSNAYAAGGFTPLNRSNVNLDREELLLTRDGSIFGYHTDHGWIKLLRPDQVREVQNFLTAKSGWVWQVAA